MSQFFTLAPNRRHFIAMRYSQTGAQDLIIESMDCANGT